MSPGVKKIVTWAAIAFVAFFIITNPDQFGNALQSIASALVTGFESVITALTSAFD